MATTSASSQQTTGNVPQPTNNPNGSATPANRPTVRIQFSSNGQARAPALRVNSSPGNNPALRRIAMPPIVPPPPLPPLEPQPQPHPRASGTDELKRFECAICYEFLVDPVGCGSPSCPNRFCKQCLERVVLRDLQTQQQARQAKCPHCRTVVDPSSIRLDRSLVREMNACPTKVTCPFEGCRESFTLQQLSMHEASCPHTPVHCRYYPYGCEWIGKRCELVAHDEHCRFARWKTLIESIRKNQWETKHVISQQHGLMNLNHALIHSNRMMISSQWNNCSGGLFFVLRMMYEAVLFPARFVMNGVWNVQIQEGNMICNQILMWSWLGVVFRTSIVGVWHLPRVIYLIFEEEEGRSDELWDLVEMMVLSLAVGVMGVLLVACFYADSSPPDSWTGYDIGSTLIGAKPCLVRDIAACCMALIVFTSMDFYGSIRGCMLWSMASSLSLVSTSFMIGMMQKIVGRNTSVSAMAPRNSAVVKFGVRYGFAMYICEFAPLIGAILILRMIPQKLRVKAHMFVDTSGTDCFISYISSSHATVAVIAYVAAAASMYHEQILQPLLQVAVATCLLVAINLYIHLLERAGPKLAEMNSARNAEMNNNNTTPPAAGAAIQVQKPSAVGACVAAALVFTAVLIATI